MGQRDMCVGHTNVVASKRSDAQLVKLRLTTHARQQNAVRRKRPRRSELQTQFRHHLSAQPLAMPAPSAQPLARASASAAVAADGESEVALLQRAQAALGASPAQALAITDEHQRRFRGGILGQEREVIAINALVRLGRSGEARSRATRFLTSYPRSAHRPRLEALLPGVGEGVPAP